MQPPPLHRTTPSSPASTPPHPPSPPRYEILPRRKELSSQLITEFLDQNLGTREDLNASRAPLLLSDLSKQCSCLDSRLQALQRDLSKRAVSWISRSFAAKSAVTNLNLAFENLSLRTSSPYGFRSKNVHKALLEELPQLANHIRQVENIREYFDTALQLEALVGDLEDTVFSAGGLRAGNMQSAKLLTSQVSMDFGKRQERLLQSTKLINKIEERLVIIARFHPQWHCLLESVDVRVDKSLAVVRPQILADHRALLASLGWPPKLVTPKSESGEVVELPNPLALMEGDGRRSYSQSFLALCALQLLQAQREDRQHRIFGRKEYGTGLWAIDELVSPIASRIEYHFSKWAEQPEFMFALVYKITRDVIVGVDDVLQPLIDRARLANCSAKEAWVSAMVQMLSGFLARKLFPVLAERYGEKHMREGVMSSWLHLVDHIVAFDKQIQLLLSSESSFFRKEAKMFEGLLRAPSALMIFSDRPEWLKIWAKIEFKDAWKKLKSELKNERAWLAVKESGAGFQTGVESEQFLLSTREDHKSPLVAESVLKIVWMFIERCQTLPTVQPRIRFVRLSAGRFLWYFFNLLALRCKNVDFSLDSLEDALSKVCGSINAARYIQSKLLEWSDDINFLEMRIAEKDNCKGGNNDAVHDDCFFVEEIKSLGELMTNWLIEIITALLHHFEALSSGYLQNEKSFEQEQEGLDFDRIAVTMDLVVSADIVEALDVVKNQLHVLKMSLNLKDFLDLWRGVADGLDLFISRSILATGVQFSKKGIKLFGGDMKALFLVFQPFCARPEAFFPCITEILKLLKMSQEETKQLQVALSNHENGIKYLPSCGISHLSLDQVYKILRNIEFTS
ncbi:hypothetical protein Tsubulata_011176 [Turnera subulata]|uniref:RAD50-interacting protein 1 n=1 Tax=Turnera subulata TaxID=218843 RepID=A0A9Q0J2H1_9ROSI|nr:hypothetical protein Tsubulata_011176 [Turnera subulata]